VLEFRRRLQEDQKKVNMAGAFPCLIGMKIHITPPEFIGRLYDFCWNNDSPSGLIKHKRFIVSSCPLRKPLRNLRLNVFYDNRGAISFQKSNPCYQNIPFRLNRMMNVFLVGPEISYSGMM